MNYTIEDGRSKVFQWDKDVAILLPDIADGTEIHFGVSPFNAIRRIVADGKVRIPNILFQKNRDIPMFVYIDDITTDSALIPVVGRPKPPDYIYTETEVLVWESVTKRMDDIENAWNGGVYYEVDATQPDEYTMRMTYTPTHEGMKEIPPQDIALPKGGPRGERGEQGVPGKSAYEYAQDGGYTGTEAAFASKLALGMDSTPTSGSKNHVTSGGVYTALSKKLNAAGVTANNFLVGAGNSNMATKTPAQVLALIGAAPEGYGLGKISYGGAGTDIADPEDLDSLTANGFWCYRNSTTPLVIIDGYTKYVQGMTLAYSGVNAVQIAYCLDSGTMIVRSLYNSTWEGWRFENPPMAVGTEYPTTEKRNGATIYRKRVSYTNTAAFGTQGTTTSITIPHGIEGFGTIVRCAAKAASYPLPHIGASGHITCVVSVDATNITLRTLNAWAANVTWDFDLAYTKS